MDLQKFISASIIQIVDGVRDAQKHIEDTKHDPYRGAVVSPYGKNDSDKKIHNVEFDVAVVVTDDVSKSGGAGITVCGFQLGCNGNLEQSNTTTSRIKFSVPVIYSSAKP